MLKQIRESTYVFFSFCLVELRRVRPGVVVRFGVVVFKESFGLQPSKAAFLSVLVQRLREHLNEIHVGQQWHTEVQGASTHLIVVLKTL